MLRFLTYYNRGRMGNYDEAISLGQLTGTIPDIKADDKEGRTKYGVSCESLSSPWQTMAKLVFLPGLDGVMGTMKLLPIQKRINI